MENKKNTETLNLNQLPPLNVQASNARRQQERHRENQKQARQLIEKKLQEKQEDIAYIKQAQGIAARLPEQGRTKKELLAVAYRQVRANLNRENTSLDMQFRHKDFYDGFQFQPMSYFITDDDREAYLQKHQTMIAQHITKLETEAQYERQALVDKRALHDTVKNRVAQIQSKQAKRDAELDKQIAEVKKRTLALQAQIANRHQNIIAQPEDPNLDRLEKMLEELRRIKNGMA